MKCPERCRGFCCCRFDCASLVRCGKRRGLTEEEAVAEDMESKEEAGDQGEKDIPKMEGYLEKKGKSRLVSSWRRYWFVLEGRRLTYYESQLQPSAEHPPNCKGSLTIAPATTVTTSKLASSNGAGHQPSYREIYILNSTRLVTLRTKDAEQHSSWVKALVASTKLPVKLHPANGSKIPKSAEATCLFPLRPSSKFFRYSLTNLSTQEAVKPPWPKNGSHTMDSRSCSLYQRKSGSLDDIIDRYDDATKDLGKEAVFSDSDDEENEDPKSKTISPNSEDHLTSQTPSECSVPMNEHELQSARLCESKEKDLVQKTEQSEEMSSPSADDWDRIHASSNVGENYEAEHDLSRYIELTGHRTGKQSETHEGKIKARRFLTSLVPKDTKIFEGICKQDKTPKRDRQSVSSDMRGTATQLPSEKNERPKVKHKPMPTQPESKERVNDTQRGQKAMATNEPSQSGSSVRNTIMKKTSEFRSARRARRNKDKKKSESDEIDSKDASHEPSFVRQNSRKEKAMTIAPLLDENDVKKKRRRMGFLSKMLRGKKSDGHEEAAERYDILEDLPFDGVDSTSYKFNASHGSGLTDDDSPPRAHSMAVPPHLSFGLKLFPSDDAELKKKLESRMARIEFEMAMAAENEKLTESVPPLATNASNTPSAEDVGVMDANRMSIEESLSSPPPVLPPRIIKLTPPTPPVHGGQQEISFGDGSPSLLEELLPMLTDSSARTNELELSEGGVNNEIILCERDDSGWKGSSQSRVELGCDNDGVMIPELMSPLSLNGNKGEERDVSQFQSDVLRTMLQMSDVESNADNGVSDRSGMNSSSRTSWENNREQDCDSVSSALRLHSSAIEPFPRAGGHVDELSLLLSELDRINASPLHHDVPRQNQRPLSDGVKKTTTFEVDYITAFPIRRRRNSDPDYDIPRPHRIPHIQATKEENRVEIPSASSKPPLERRSSGRENTDSIVIEATRFFGPGMDFSFNEKKYSALKDSEDLWYYHDCSNEEMNGMSPDYSYNGGYERLQDRKSDGDMLAKTMEEPSIPSSSHVNDGEELQEAGELKYADKNDCVLRSKHKLEVVEDDDSDKVVLRSSGLDRACRKERSREIYEADLTDQFKLNDSLEGLSISSKLEITGESTVDGNEAFSDGTTTAASDLSTNESFTPGVPNEEASSKPSQELHNVNSLENPELNHSNPMHETLNEHASETTEVLNTLPESMPASTTEEGAGLENYVDDHDNEVVLRSKPEGSSREDSRAYRLSFATTETLLVEEEVLVATLKTTTTTTTLLPMEDGSTRESRENIEEFVEEIVLDMDQLSDDRFDSMQVHSCVQT